MQTIIKFKNLLIANLASVFVSITGAIQSLVEIGQLIVILLQTALAIIALAKVMKEGLYKKKS